MKKTFDPMMAQGGRAFVRRFWTLAFLLLMLPWLPACGNTDAEPIVKNFCSGVKTGDKILDVFRRAEKEEFDKYWLEKYDSRPGEGDVLGVVRQHDLEDPAQAEKIAKLKSPDTWEAAQFKAMIQKFGYSRYVCSVDFSKGTAVSHEVYSLS